MANHIAVSLDRETTAEMSCIAGVGGDVQSLVNVAKSGRPIVVIDGCPLQCAKSCLKRHDVDPDIHFVLSDFDIPKQMHRDYDRTQANDLQKIVKEEIKNRYPDDEEP